MLQIQTKNLPPTEQQRLHPDFFANEKAYLQMRERLLPQYKGQWVAIHDGKVVASGGNLMEVLEEAGGCGGHPFVALVGAEDAVVFRTRRAVYAYDQAYQPFPLPHVSATFWNHAETHSQMYMDVIPDTGADVTVLPGRDCKTINLFSSPYLTGMTGGVIGNPLTSLFYRAKVEIDGRRFPALIQSVPAGKERIIGRDVLNQQRVLFDGPAGTVIVDP